MTIRRKSGTEYSCAAAHLQTNATAHSCGTEWQSPHNHGAPDAPSQKSSAPHTALRRNRLRSGAPQFFLRADSRSTRLFRAAPYCVKSARWLPLQCAVYFGSFARVCTAQHRGSPFENLKCFECLRRETNKYSARHRPLHTHFQSARPTPSQLSTAHGWYPDTHPRANSGTGPGTLQAHPETVQTTHSS